MQDVCTAWDCTDVPYLLRPTRSILMFVHLEEDSALCGEPLDAVRRRSAGDTLTFPPETGPPSVFVSGSIKQGRSCERKRHCTDKIVSRRGWRSAFTRPCHQVVSRLLACQVHESRRGRQVVADEAWSCHSPSCRPTASILPPAARSRPPTAAGESDAT